MTLDMTFEAREKLIKRDAFKEGIEQGILKGRNEEHLNTLYNAIQGGVSKDTLINVFHYTDSEYETALEELRLSK